MKIFLLFFGILFSPFLNGQNFFVDVTVISEIDHIHVAPNLMGGGVAIIDFNNDGFEDLYLTGGIYEDKIFQNLGNKKFLEKSAEVGVFASTRFVTTQSVTAGDINNDGFTDIFVCTGDGYSNLLFLNNGDGTFEDISKEAGFSSKEWSMGATFGDFNLDGYLDIYVTNYIKTPNPLLDSNDQLYGFAHECYLDKLYINKGDNTFIDFSIEYGAINSGCGLAVTSTDINLDGNLDVYVANDFGKWILPNTSLINNYPKNNFINMSEALGMDVKLYAMGIATGDVNNDGLYDYYITNLGANALLVQDEGGKFYNHAEKAGVENENVNTYNSTGWGTEFFDFNHDGYEDLVVSNGYIGSADFLMTTFNDPNKLFMNNGDNTFKDVSEKEHISDSSISRGLATLDYDNDGDLDMLFVNAGTTLNEVANVKLYENQKGNELNWLKIRLQGVQANKEGIGASVSAYYKNKIWVDEISGGGSHASKKSNFAHFGLSNIEILDSIKVMWPGSKNQVFRSVITNQFLAITEDEIEFDVVGCMDNTRLNYDPAATYNGGCNNLEETVLSTEKELDPFVVYPNPVESIIHLQSIDNSINNNDFDVILEDMTGKSVLSYRSIHNDIDVRKLVKGVYYLKLSVKNKTVQVEKIFIN